MSSGIDFSSVRNAASDLLVLDSTDANAHLLDSLVTNARRLLELTDPKVDRTPDQDAKLLVVLDALQRDERFGGDRSSYHRAHEALAWLIQARGAESGRPVGASAAAVLHGSPPSASASPNPVSSMPGPGGFVLVGSPGPVESPDRPAIDNGVDRNVVAVMGAGKMGSDIAYALLSAGFMVRVFDVQPGQVERSQENILRMIEKGVANGKLSRDQGIEMTRRIQFYSGEELLSAAVKGAGYVMEAVFESFDVKRDLFQRLNGIAHPDTIFLTNTSALKVTDLALASGRPDRFAGAHFFWPAYQNPLLEITSASDGPPAVARKRKDGTRWMASDETLALAHAFGRRLGKVMLDTADTPGFIANRFFVPWLNEGGRLLDDVQSFVFNQHMKGANRYDQLVSVSPTSSREEDQAHQADWIAFIDVEAKRLFKIGAGPFRLMNLTGPQIAEDSLKSMVPLGDVYKPAPRLVDLVGRKQLWTIPDSQNPDKKAGAREIAEQEQAVVGKIESILTPDDLVTVKAIIRDRLMGAAFRIALNLADEGVSPTDIDIAATVGLAWKKGPFALMNDIIREQGIDELRRLVAAYDDQIAQATFSQLVDGRFELPAVSLRVEGGVGRIRIERPGSLNVLDPQVVADLGKAFEAAEHDEQVRMIVIEGLGGQLAGADIGFFVKNLAAGKEGLDRIMAFTKEGLDLFSRIEKSEKRVVAVIDGGAFGGGFELALAAHDIIVTPQAKLALPETGLGIIPGLRGADRLAKRVGTGVAFWMMATGDPGENAISGADLAAIEASISLVERADLEEKLRKFAAGERNSLIRDQNPTQRRYAAIDNLFGFSPRGSQMRDDLVNGVAHSELTGEEKEIYDKVLAIAAKRPRAALQLANQLLDVDSDDDDYRIVEQVFLTPMALQGLSSMGRKIEVETWTSAQWVENLLRVSSAQFEKVIGTTLVLKVNKVKPTADEVLATAHVIRNRLNSLVTDGKLNDISRAQLFYEKDGSEPQALVIERETPGGKFEIGAQPIKGGPTGHGGGGTSTSMAGGTPSSQGAPESGSGLSTIAQGRDDDGEHAGDRQQPSGRPDRLREQGIGRGSQGPEVGEAEDRRPQRRGSSSGRGDTGDTDRSRGVPTGSFATAQDDRGHTASVRLVSTSALVTGAVHLVGSPDADAVVTERQPAGRPRATTVKRVAFPAGAGLPPVARPAGMPVLFR